MSDVTPSPSKMPELGANTRTGQQTAAKPQAPSNAKPKIFGLYGVDGSGKTYLLKQLNKVLGEDDFTFYDGSAVINDVYEPGLDAFKNLPAKEKKHWREVAIEKVQKDCADRGKIGVVAGHYMFWNNEQKPADLVCTQKDLDIFTHILYLNVPAKVVAERRLKDLKDRTRERLETSEEHLAKWQKEEMDRLRELCRHNDILFSTIRPPMDDPRAELLDKVVPLLRDFQYHNEGHNMKEAKRALDAAVRDGGGKWETVLVLDADRTLAPDDAGALFWEEVRKTLPSMEPECPLKKLYGGPMKYSHNAFRQAVFLHEESAGDQEFDDFCEAVASNISVYPEFLALLQRNEGHVGAVIVTCGLHLVWNKVLEKAGLSETVKVIGGGRISDGYVVTAKVKAALVTRLQDRHHMHVLAFGDSELDLPMLHAADQAIVVVGEKKIRSTTMEEKLKNALNNNGLRAQQVVLPNHVSPRLDTSKLPLIELTSPEFLDSVIRRRKEPANIEVIHATTKNAAKVLMTLTRDAKKAGPVLREHHRQIGWYLATEYLTDVIGTEVYKIDHVQGGLVDGHRLKYEKQTAIVALMRGGEPMAFGVNDAFPLAMFVHAKEPDDLKYRHLCGQRTVILVDSVVNNGTTMVNFVRHVRSLHPTIRIVVVAGVVQDKAVGIFKEKLNGRESFSLVALRLSTNKYTGKGTVDTGNRLFNSTALD